VDGPAHVRNGACDVCSSMTPPRPRSRLTLVPRRDALRLAVMASAGIAGAWLAGCTGQARIVEPSTAGAPVSAKVVAPTAQAGRLVGVLPSSDVAVGTNVRFLLGILDDGNRPVSNAAVQLKFFKFLDEATGQLRAEAPATFRGSPQLGDRGLYVARVDLDEAGKWGVEVATQRPGQAAQTFRLTFDVKAQSQTPAIGAPAPTSQTATAATPAEAETVCSARPADEFHRLSIAQALAERKPLVVLFARRRSARRGRAARRWRWSRQSRRRTPLASTWSTSRSTRMVARRSSSRRSRNGDSPASRGSSSSARTAPSSTSTRAA
jgi:hypothetical protein